MSTLYVTLQGARLRKEQGRLLVQLHGATHLEALWRDLDRLVLLGGIELTGAVLAECLLRGVDVCWLTQDGRLKGRLVGADSKNGLLRLAQYRLFDDPPRRLPLARALVDAKLRNSLRLLTRFASEHPEVDLRRQLGHLRAARTAAAAAPGLDSLRGQEGRAGAAYFAALTCMFRGSLTFARRRRRPPPDPVNALLSLGYTLVGNELTAALTARGFDPYLGYLHEPAYGRPSLAQDLLEEFRAGAVDRLVLKVCNRGMLSPADFEPGEEGGLHLTKTGFRTFIAAYEAHLTTPFQREGRQVDLRRCFVLQAQALARAVEDGEAYAGHQTR